MKIISVVGARPNFIKIAPIHRAITKFKFQNAGYKIEHLICHTGQHYDRQMSNVFFQDLELPEPDFYLGVGSGSHAVQTAKIMVGFEKVLLNEKPDLIIVVGDVNSTIACSLVASKMGIKVAHIEAGLRSFDMTMPEEINRILTDHISDYLFVTEKSGIDNLKNEGVDSRKVYLVGNVMIDSLKYYLERSLKSEISNYLKLTDSEYIVTTLHRPANVDSVDFLKEFVELANVIPQKIKIIFPVHPRTLKNICDYGLKEKFDERILIIEPVGYIDFVCLLKNATLVITDSGGIQEETTYLGVQCITLRDNTERPITVEEGTNWLLGTDLQSTKKVILDIINGKRKIGKIPEKWDGKAAERIVKILGN